MSAGATARPASRFRTEYGPLRPERPGLGEVALLPWDAEVFGFPVADFRPGVASELASDTAGLARSLVRLAADRGVELVGCRVPAHDAESVAALEAAGFRFVELQIGATRPRLESGGLEPPRMTVRRAETADHARIVEIAESAFSFGRYHADPFFPRELASRRFRIWMERALADSSPATWVGVLGLPGEPVGFAHTEREDEIGDIRLVASDPAKAALAGPALVLGALHELAASGATRATARLSPSNVAALNVYASLRFQFHDPEVVLHWSPPGRARVRPQRGD